MDGSQNTPTQVNEDRSYADTEAEEVYDSLPSSLTRSHPQETGTGDRTLQPDDTGAVNFGNFSELPRPSSQVSEDGGFENARGDWRNPDQTSQQLSNPMYTPFRPQAAAFETPALPKNPFAAAKDFSVPLGGTQMFGQTQFSSAIKQITPGSSRPSPNVLMSNISPNVAETSPLKNRANVSSPTDIRTSSPQRLDEVPPTVRRNSLERIEEETASASRSTENEIVPESPTNKAPRSSGNRQPLAHYETLKRSQERKFHGEPDDQIVASDSDSDSAVKGMERRKKAERKRAKAAMEMQKVVFTPVSQRNPPERPARKRRKTDEAEAIVQASSGMRGGQSSSENGNALVADSQRAATFPLLDEADISTQGDDIETALQEGIVANSNDQAVTEPEAVNDEVIEERILATSPVPGASGRRLSEPELPSLETGTSRAINSSNDARETSSLPPPRRNPPATHRTSTRQQRRRTVVSSPVSDGTMVQTPREVPQTLVKSKSRSSQLDLTVNTEYHDRPAGKEMPPPKSSAPMTTRSRSRADNSPLTPRAKPPSEAPTTSSSGGELSSAPSSLATTPGTRESLRSKQIESVAETSPIETDSPRKRTSKADAASISPRLSSRNLRASRRVRYGSESTDELYPSSAGVLEQSVMNPKSSHRFIRQSMGQTHRGPQLFQGMAFSLTFQADVRSQERTKLETKISQAGGYILPEGFEPLFEPSAIMDATSPVFDDDEPLKLRKPYADTGFTALITDGHSRKAKYMQALALGLPCIAHQWISACIDSGSLVDWEHYLLCSGNSAVLGNAIRSRTLTPYPAAEAGLADVVNNRAKLLLGQRVLVVVDSKKGRNSAKRPYIFLAQALGPTVSRVFTTKQATEALVKHAEEGRPFDWLYVDEGMGTVESVLSGDADTNSKKRKRSVGKTKQPAVGDIRVLNDELVIQSLILGRIVQDNEMLF